MNTFVAFYYIFMHPQYESLADAVAPFLFYFKCWLKIPYFDHY